YLLITILLSRLITTKEKKISTETNNYNNYNILTTGVFLSSGIIGKEIVEVALNSYNLIIEIDSDSILNLFKFGSVFAGFGLFLLVITFLISHFILKLLFKKIKLINYLDSNQYGYFLM